MAKKLDRSDGFTFENGKAVTKYRELRPDDCEPWVKSDHSKAQAILSQAFSDASDESSTRKDMARVLVAEIGQDFVSIGEAIDQFFMARKAKEIINLPVPELDIQLQAWKTMPKDQALKAAMILFKSSGLEPAEERVKLEELKFISEVSGATLPSHNNQNVIAININVAELPPGMGMIDIKRVQ